MSKYRAIPEGYMTVGELAKKMDVTVRTLQYYDREGVLSPSMESAGGRRLYTDKDLVRLHQILSLKSLGFSLDDIKNHLIALETPEDVAGALADQAAAIRKKIETLSESLKEIEILREEALQMQSVDFKKYADIITNLRMKNEYYWMIKHLDDQVLDHFHGLFNMDSGLAMLETLTRLFDEAVQFQKDGVPPGSEKGQRFAGEYWDMIMKFTGGDAAMLSKLMEMNESMETDHVMTGDMGWKQKQAIANEFIIPALEEYFDKKGLDPFQGVTK